MFHIPDALTGALAASIKATNDLTKALNRLAAAEEARNDIALQEGNK